jgi:hypothetical protein
MGTVLYQVNGPAVVYVSGGKVSPSSKLALGIARERIKIAVNHHDGKIPADNAGPNLPADVQYFGKDATIRATLSEFDPDVLDLLEQLDASGPGQLGTIGIPMGAAGLTFRVQIPSNYRPWTFYNCVLRSRGDAIGTEFSLLDLEFYAFALIGNAINAKGTPLYAHTF